MQEEKQTVFELIVGVLFCVLVFGAGNLFVSNRFAYTMGLLLGGIIAVIMSIHMYGALQKAVFYDEETASKKMKISALIRMLFMIAALIAAVLLPQFISIIGVVLGVICLKFSAYLQPLTHKVFNKFIHKGR